MSDGTGLAEKMLGQSGVLVYAQHEHTGEVTVTVESIKRKAWCLSYREQAQAGDRVEVCLGDVHSFGCPTGLVAATGEGVAGARAMRRGPGPRRSTVSLPARC